MQARGFAAGRIGPQGFDFSPGLEGLLLSQALLLGQLSGQDCAFRAGLFRIVVGLDAEVCQGPLGVGDGPQSRPLCGSTVSFGSGGGLFSCGEGCFGVAEVGAFCGEVCSEGLGFDSAVCFSGAGGVSFDDGAFGQDRDLAELAVGAGGSFSFSGGLGFGGTAGGGRLLSLLASSSQRLGRLHRLAGSRRRPLYCLSSFVGSPLRRNRALPHTVLGLFPCFLRGQTRTLGLGDLRMCSFHGGDSRSLHLIEPSRHGRQRLCQSLNRSAYVVQLLPEPIRVQPEGRAPRIQPEGAERLPLRPSQLSAGPSAFPARIPAETPRPSALHPRSRQLSPALAVPAPPSLTIHARNPMS